MTQLKFFVLICFLNGVCKANPIMYLKISKNEVIPLKSDLIITSKAVTVKILVDVILPVQSDDVVTLDQLVCYDNKSNHIIFNNLNFAYVAKYLTTNYTQYRYKSSQKLKKLRDGNVLWQWLCKLYAQWDGYNVDFEFEVNVEMLEKNDITSHETDEKMALHMHQEPVKTKGSTKKITSDLYEDVSAEKNNLEPTEKIISNKNPEKDKEKQPTAPKSSVRNTEQTSRDQKGKNQRHLEKNDTIDLNIELIPSNTLNNTNNAKDEISTSTNWVIFLVTSVVIFIVGLAIGAICKWRPKNAVELPEITDDQTYEHIYEQLLDKGIQNRPPLPVPEEAVYIYNSPYDHARWFQNQSALNGTLPLKEEEKAIDEVN